MSPRLVATPSGVKIFEVDVVIPMSMVREMCDPAVDLALTQRPSPGREEPSRRAELDPASPAVEPLREDA